MFGLGTVLFYLIVGYRYKVEIDEEQEQVIIEHINNVHPHALNLIVGMLNPDFYERFTLQ